MKLTLVLALFVATIAGVCGFIQQRNQTGERSALAAQQSEQIANLQSEQQRLSGLAANSPKSSDAAADHQAEVAKLRTQAGSLREQTNRLAKQTKTASTPSPAADKTPESHPPEYWEQIRQAAGTKPIDARDVSSAAYMYALDHGQVPTNMNQVIKYLPKTGRTKPTTNRFEFVFAGSLDQLKGIPHTSIAIVRDTQTWTTSDGKQARVYGMMGGVGQIVTSDDNFQSWEAEHVISPPGATPQVGR